MGSKSTSVGSNLVLNRAVTIHGFGEDGLVFFEGEGFVTLKMGLVTGRTVNSRQRTIDSDGCTVDSDNGCTMSCDDVVSVAVAYCRLGFRAYWL
ncbi:hypothetical protein AKJ16_DCAP23078 [Drosera capensis]